MAEPTAPAIERRASGHEAETRAIGRELARRLPADALVLVYGDLGSGKTVFAQGMGEALGLDRGEVQSPSYTLVREHQRGDRRLVHVDLYRLEPADLPGVGLEELLAGPGLKVVEWAERIDFPLPAAWRVRIARGRKAGSRHIEIEQTARELPAV